MALAASSRLKTLATVGTWCYLKHTRNNIAVDAIHSHPLIVSVLLTIFWQSGQVFDDRFLYVTAPSTRGKFSSSLPQRVLVLRQISPDLWTCVIILNPLEINAAKRKAVGFVACRMNTIDSLCPDTIKIVNVL